MVKQPIITVNNLVKNYGDFNAVKDISFEVYEGEIFGLLGPNGAGKTTTLEIIETLRDKTSGEIIVDGFNVDKDPDAIKKRIGVQLQAAGYYPNLNLTELIQLFSGLYGIEKSPMEMLEKVALTDKAKAKYSAFPSLQHLLTTRASYSWTNLPPASTHRHGVIYGT
jgi:ABC-2 type transport system ATP-binding protein